MRRFSSYGPIDLVANFGVARQALVEKCVEALVGQPKEIGGHYFTIWGARQTGKTWIMRRAVDEIRTRYRDEFHVALMSVQSVILDGDNPAERFLAEVSHLFRLTFGLQIQEVKTWRELARLFERNTGAFGDKPVILLIDEFDKLPQTVIDRLVTLFRDMYLTREAYVLHGLALAGVRSVLGVDSPRGSPFNVQRAMHVPHLTSDEVHEMFRQYQSESGQTITEDVVTAVYDVTRGQPGLVSWFGELLTEKYNPGKESEIGWKDWRNVYQRALHTEWNNTLLNLQKKSSGEYRPAIMQLFTDPNIPFSMRDDWCSYLVMNGIIAEARASDPNNSGDEIFVCRFSCPFIQESLFASFAREMFGDKGPILAKPIDDPLDDVFTNDGIRAPALLERYRDYLKRLKTKGIDPWIGQPRRQDLQYTEAVGHFHLYAWLKDAVGRRCVISPEFPTGNGRVDLLLRKQNQLAIIEVKSLRDIADLAGHRNQAAAYAKKLNTSEATLVLFAPTDDEAILAKLAGEIQINEVHVTVVPFGWV